jgi:hypothetical protein
VSIVRAVVLGMVIAATMVGCMVHHFIGGPRLTGTCDGACAHYVECKPGHADADGERCRTECPGVFADRDSLMAYESLSCTDAVEYVDGKPTKAATSER